MQYGCSTPLARQYVGSHFGRVWLPSLWERNLTDMDDAHVELDAEPLFPVCKSSVPADVFGNSVDV